MPDAVSVVTRSYLVTVAHHSGFGTRKISVHEAATTVLKLTVFTEDDAEYEHLQCIVVEQTFNYKSLQFNQSDCPATNAVGISKVNKWIRAYGRTSSSFTQHPLQDESYVTLHMKPP